MDRMNGEPFQFAPERPGSPGARCDAEMAEALRQLCMRLCPATAAVYFLTADGNALKVSMVIDTPLSFTVIPSVPLDDPNRVGAAAYQSGKIVIRDQVAMQKAVEGDPALVQYIPFSCLIVAAPLQTVHRRFGVLILDWVPPRYPDAKQLEFIQSVANALAVKLEREVELGVSVNAPITPWFVPLRSESQEESESALTSLARPIGLRGRTAFLYQFQRLAAELSAAVQSHDIVATMQSQVVQPFGGTGVALCLTENGRLQVAGSAGFAKEDLRALDGILLTPGAPEADAMSQIRPTIFTTPELHLAYPKLDRYHEGHAWMFLPLIADRRVVGCSVIVCDRHRPFEREELAVLITMLGQVGQSLQRVLGHEWEQSLAQTMQKSLLPRRLPHLKEIVTTSRYVPAMQGAGVGGDWYDMIRLSGNRIGLIIGDVEGHNIDAAGVMAQLRSGVRAYAAEGHEPACVLERSNRLLVGLDTGLFATCCCMWLDLDTGMVGIASAGHPFPVINDQDGRLTTPTLSTGPPLGVDPDATFEQADTLLEPGSLVALYTDGLLDLRHHPVERALSKLCEQLTDRRTLDLEALADELIKGASASSLRDDDLVLLLMRYEGAQPDASRRVARYSIERNDLQQVRRLRHTLERLACTWQLQVDVDELQLLISEVVTNSLIHAQTEVDVLLRSYPGRLRVEVRDSNPRPPILAAILGGEEAVNDEAESGRGMLIVDAVAWAWGTSPAGRGKTTWFELKAKS